MRQLLRREENRLSDMLEQVTRYRVERFRREQMERVKSFPPEIQKEEIMSEKRKSIYKEMAEIGKKKKIVKKYANKPIKSYAALIKEVNDSLA